MMARKVRGAAGVTMMELLVVMVVAAVLVILAVPLFFETFSSRLKTSTQNLSEDLRFAQNEAVRQGEASPGGAAGAAGAFRTRKVFVVFEPLNNRYRIWRWEDTNGNNARDAGEFNPNLAGVAGGDAPVRTGTLASGVSFSLYSTVNARACGNGLPVPAGAVTFPTDAGFPCNGNPCIRFDGKGFLESGEGAAYVTDNENAFAVSGSRAGLFSFCKWDKGAVPPQWVPAR